jgi:hypothetical protein
MAHRDALTEQQLGILRWIATRDFSGHFEATTPRSEPAIRGCDGPDRGRVGVVGTQLDPRTPTT